MLGTLRHIPNKGFLCWGARTFAGDDESSSEWKYVSVRRTALFIEESLYEGLQWAVFEPNDEKLWTQIRMNVSAFMSSLFRQGAFAGRTSAEAFAVRCGSQTTTSNDIDHGIVNVLVGFAPVRPAEFVLITVRQRAGALTD